MHRLTYLRASIASRGLGRQLLTATLGGAGVSILGLGFTFLAGIQLARGLGVDGYGIYGIAMAVVSMLGVPSQFGIPQLLMREVAASAATHQWSVLRGVLQWAFARVSVTTLVIAALLCLYVSTLGPGLTSDLGRTLIAGSLLIPLVALAALTGAGLRGLLHSVLGQLPDYLIRPAAFSIFLLIFLLSPIAFTPWVAMLAGLLSAVSAVLVGSFLLVRHLPPEVVATTDGVKASAMWTRAAMPMALAEGMRVVEGQAAIIALGALASVGEVGLFRVATSVLGLLGFPLTVFNLVASPAISRLYATGDRARLQRMLGYVAAGMTLSVLALTLPLALFGNRLLGYFFGQEFADSNPILLVLALGACANGALGVGASFLNMVGRQQRVTRASIISISALCAMLVPFIAIGGGLGAACAVTLASTTWSFLLWRDAKRFVGYDVSLWAVVKSDIP